MTTRTDLCRHSTWDMSKTDLARIADPLNVRHTGTKGAILAALQKFAESRARWYR